MSNFIQINLSTDLPYKHPYICKYMIYDPKNNLTFIDNLSIYEINVTKFKNLCYNNTKPSIIAMLDMNLDELLNIKGDKLMEKLKNEAIDLNNDDNFVKFLDDETEDRLFVNTFIDIGKKEGMEKGIEQGIKQGIEQNNIEITKRMLQKNTDINFISEITNLSIEEINELKNQ